MEACFIIPFYILFMKFHVWYQTHLYAIMFNEFMLILHWKTTIFCWSCIYIYMVHLMPFNYNKFVIYKSIFVYMLVVAYLPILSTVVAPHGHINIGEFWWLDLVLLQLRLDSCEWAVRLKLKTTAMWLGQGSDPTHLVIRERTVFSFLFLYFILFF
jgi:hypothetical protein